jgi:transposase InsO family protein
MRRWELRLFSRFSPALVLKAFLASLLASFCSRAALQLEILALRHQIGVLQRAAKKRPKLTAADRILWAWLSGVWADWRSALVIVKPETVIAWHRKGFRLFWTWKVRHGQAGRPAVSREVRELIRQMSRDNPHWGAPRIHGELLKLGIDIGETSVGKYMVRHRRPPSQTWRTFLENHLKTMVSVDFFTVPTIRFQVLYVFLVLAHERRRILHFGVTAHPTAEWTAQQLREAFPWDTAPRYLLRDRDRIFGDDFTQQVQEFGIREVLGAPRSPWRRAYIERVIGSIRRECLDHVIIVNEGSLRRILGCYLNYYHASRTHLSLEKDSPEPRPVQPPEMGPVVATAQAGGLHHRYERRAA